MIKSIAETYRSLSEPEEIRRNKMVAIEQTSHDLTQLNDQVQSLSKLAASSSKAEAIFIRHVSECAEIGKELQRCVRETSEVWIACLERSKTSNLDDEASLARLIKNAALEPLNLRVRAHQRRGRERVGALRRRLETVQQQMVSAALVHMWANTKQKEAAGTPLPVVPSKPGIVTSESIERPPGLAGPEDEPGKHILSSEMMRNTWALLRLGRRFSDTDYHSELAPEIKSINQKDVQLCRHVTAHCLFYERLGFREGAIDPAHAKTFEWIFQTPPANQAGDPIWTSFQDWLRGHPPNNIYWITGKPGAGKSTLVKFIIEDQRTKDSLGEWAGGQPLIILSSYFWLAGGELQRSREGLLRTLLYQVLSQQPDLVPRMFPQRWTLAKVFGRPALDLKWEFDELVHAFQTLIRHSTAGGKVAIFVDGLDEFHGEHQTLVDLVQEMAGFPNLKICVSSRPWNIFRDNFSRGPGVRVETLTGPDIKLYVRDRFADSAAFGELEDLDNAGAKRLVTDIVTKSQGVFLWVTVVVTALLEGLADGDSLEELERKLIGLPDKLNNLFDVIWHGIKPEHHSETSRYLEMVRATEALGLGLNAFTAWLTQDAYSIGMSRAEVMSIDQVKAVSALSRRLTGRTKGLIEILRPLNSAPNDVGVVVYMHRTVRDWASAQSTIQQLQSSTAEDGSGWDVNLCLLKGETLRLATIPSNIDYSQNEEYWPSSPQVQREVGLACDRLDSFWEDISPFFQIASQVAVTDASVSSFVSIMDRIDIELTRVAMVTPVRGDGSCQGSYWFFGIHWLSIDPHWSNVQKVSRDMLRNGTTVVNELRQGDLGFPSDYIIFASQIPLVHYVRVKMNADPRILYRLIAAYGTYSPNWPANRVSGLSPSGRFWARPFNCLFEWQDWRGDSEMCGILRLFLEPGADLRPVKRMKLQKQEIIKLIQEFEKTSPRRRRIRDNFFELVSLRVDHQSIHVNITSTLMELTLYVSNSAAD